MKTTSISVMAIFAAALAVVAQTPAPAPLAPAAPTAPIQAVPAPAPVAPALAPMPTMPVMPALAPMPAPLVNFDAFAFEQSMRAAEKALDLADNFNFDFGGQFGDQFGDKFGDIGDKITAKINAGIKDKIDTKIGEKIDKVMNEKMKFTVDTVNAKLETALAGVPFGVWQGQDPTEMARRAQEMSQRQAERQQEMVQRQLERANERFKGGSEETLYRRGTSLLDDSQWAKAVEAFDAVISKNGTHADGATYWKAWALYKEGQKDPSLTALAGLETNYPKSRWLNDAKALTVEVKQSSGTPVQPGSTDDEDIKVLALNGLMHSNPDAAIPALERILKGSGGPRLKERALFVLSTQANGTKAREVLAQIARGASNPDLQLKAIQYYARTGPDARPLLGEIYNSSQDETLKRRVLQSFMESGDREHLLAIAKSDSNPDFRQEAIRELAAMNDHDDVWSLYASESSPTVRKQIISSLYSEGFSPKVAEIARTEKDPEVRRTAIRTLSHFRNSTDQLAGLYDGEKDDQNKREIISALRGRNEAVALVAIARKETNPELKRQLVSALSTMKQKEATDYMVELLSK